MSVCLDFLKLKTRINEKVGNKMHLAEPKTQLFKKSCVLNSGKIHVQNALLGVLDYYRWYVHLRKCPSHRLTNSSVLSSPHLSSMSSFFVFFLFVFLCFFTGLPHNQQNPFQPLIFQTQNQQNQTKNNSKSTQKQLKINLNPENPSQTQLKINPKSIEKKNPKSQNPYVSIIFIFIFIIIIIIIIKKEEEAELCSGLKC